MNEDVTLGDAMTRAFVGVNESDDLRATVALLAEERAESAVVLRGSDPVGVVRPLDVFDYLSGGNSLDGATVEAVMADPPPVLDAGSPLSAAVARLSEAAGWQVVVTEDGAVVGTLDARDVVTAGAALRRSTETTGEVEAGLEGAVAATPADASAERSSALGAGATTSQGICEVCGALTQDLADVNGQQMCPDCRDR